MMKRHIHASPKHPVKLKEVTDMKRMLGGFCALLTMALVAFLPVGPLAAQEEDLLNQVNPRVGFTRVSRPYSTMDATYARTGTRRTIAQVHRLEVGQTVAQVQAVLGGPQVGYTDGSYEYHLSLPLTKRDRLICQYRVFFDDEGALTHAVWRRPQCAELVLGRLN
jgi:outer membrane protein assembly factor BamE (lipoprotein component of BamABCDE complex)